MSCELCKRDKPLTFHHLIPKAMHKSKWFIKNYNKTHMKKHGINICRDCHSMLHKFYDEKTLGRDFNTLEKVMADEKIMKAVKYFSKQK